VCRRTPPTNTTTTNHTYPAQMGKSYAFRVRATANVSNSAFSAAAVAKTVMVTKYRSVPSTGSGQAVGQSLAVLGP
jgi:hypothetical protein